MSEDLKKEVEALLFAAGRKVSVDELVLLCKSEKKKVSTTLEELKKEYAEKESAMFLIEEGDGWKMTVRDRYIPLVKEISPHTELSRSMLETLAVIAWKHPALQADIIKMRSSTAYEDIKILLDMGFISKEKKGRSFILKPTGRFFDYFDLPSKEKLKEMFKDIEEAEHQKDAQTQIGDIPTHPSKIGQLDVYERSPEQAAAEEAQDKERASENAGSEQFGKLPVFEVAPSEEKDLDEEEQEVKKTTIKKNKFPEEEAEDESEDQDENDAGDGEENRPDAEDDSPTHESESADDETTGASDEHIPIDETLEEAPKDLFETEGEEQAADSPAKRSSDENIKSKGRLSDELEDFADSNGEKE